MRRRQRERLVLDEAQRPAHHYPSMRKGDPRPIGSPWAIHTETGASRLIKRRISSWRQRNLPAPAGAYTSTARAAGPSNTVAQRLLQLGELALSPDAGHGLAEQGALTSLEGLTLAGEQQRDRIARDLEAALDDRPR